MFFNIRRRNRQRQNELSREQQAQPVRDQLAREQESESKSQRSRLRRSQLQEAVWLERQREMREASARVALEQYRNSAPIRFTGRPAEHDAR